MNRSKQIGDFQSFLKEDRLPADLVWIFRDDLVWTGDSLKVRAPTASRNEEAVISALASRQAREFGVQLTAVAILDERSLCTLRVPADQQEAEELMIWGLKFSVLRPLHTVVPVLDQNEWIRLKTREREPSPLLGMVTIEAVYAL